jgi:hypothetical protein
MAIFVSRVLVGLTCWHAKALTEEAGRLNDRPGLSGRQTISNDHLYMKPTVP